MPSPENEEDHSAFFAPEFELPLDRVLRNRAVRYAREACVLRVGLKGDRHQLSTGLSRAPLEGCQLHLWVVVELDGVLRWLLQMLLRALLLLLLLLMFLLRLLLRLLLLLLLLLQSLLYSRQLRPLPLDLLRDLMEQDENML